MKNSINWIDKLEWRYATKQFDKTKKISDELWDQVEQSLVLTPSSFGLQPWKFFIIKNEKKRKELVGHSWNQEQIVDASHLVVLAARTDMNGADVDRLITTTHDARGGDIAELEGYKGMMNGFIERMTSEQVSVWAENQVYIALGQLMATAAALDIDACPMEGIDPAQYDNVLGLNESGYTTVLACPMGYRDNSDKYSQAAKVRYAKSTVIEHI